MRLFALATSIAFSTKIILTVFVFPSLGSDFIHWVEGASLTYMSIQNGRIPSIGVMNVYAGMQLFLSIFYALWAALPVPHTSSWAQAIRSPYLAEKAPIIFFMKLPILLFDLFTGVLIFLLVKRVSSRERAIQAFFLWYLNPYAIYFMEYEGTFEIIPTCLTLLTALFAIRGRWPAAGLSLLAGTVLRVFPIFAFPMLTVLAIKQGAGRWAAPKFFAAFALPMFAGLYLAGYDALSRVIESFWTSRTYLGYYFTGFPRDSTVPTTFFLLFFQTLLILLFWWRRPSSGMLVLNAVTAALLVPLITTYSERYYTVWIIPLLTIYYIVADRRSTFLFCLFFFSAFLSALGFAETDFTLMHVEPLTAGIFYGTKAIYLIKVNIHAIWLRL